MEYVELKIKTRKKIILHTTYNKTRALNFGRLMGDSLIRSSQENKLFFKMAVPSVGFMELRCT